MTFAQNGKGPELFGEEKPSWTLGGPLIAKGYETFLWIPRRLRFLHTRVRDFLAIFRFDPTVRRKSLSAKQHRTKRIQGKGHGTKMGHDETTVKHVLFEKTLDFDLF